MNENEVYIKKAEQLRDEVLKVNRMLRALNNEQRLIIESYYMHEVKWNHVAETYKKVYNEERTINQLKNIRDKAIKIMLDVLNV